MIESLSVEWILFVNVLITDGKIHRVEFSDEPVEERFESKTARKLKRDLRRYFKGRKIDFKSYEIDLKVTDFARSVLELVREIPYGKIMTYGEIARFLKTSPRSVGRVLKLNPAPVIIPCHRVVSKSGLGGFSYGLKIKMELLKLEGIRLLSSNDLTRAWLRR